MSGTPILLNGRHYSIAAGLVEALKPDYDAVEVTLSQSESIFDIPALLKASSSDIPYPSSGLGSNYYRDASDRRKPTCIVNGRVPDDEIAALKAACGSNRYDVTWVDVTVEDVEAGGATVENIAGLIKTKLRDAGV